MLKKIGQTIGILLFISACAGQRETVDTNPAFTSHKYCSHELEIRWKSEKTDNGVRIEGTLRNVRTDLPYNSLELTAKLLDENGNVLAQGSHYVEGRFAAFEPFIMDIPLEQRDKFKNIRFSYSYGIGEDHYLRDFKATP